MNPLFKTLTGGFNASGNQTGNSAPNMFGGPAGMLQAAIQRAQQIAGSFQNPQQMIQQILPDAPQEIRNDPDQIIRWLQQTGRVNPQMVQMVQQMIGR